MKPFEQGLDGDWLGRPKYLLSGVRMRRLNAYDFYDIGAKIHLLERINKDHTLREALLILFNARAALDTVLTNTVLPLNICKPICIELRQTITKILPEDLSTIPAEQFDEKVNQWVVYTLAEALRKFEAVLGAELQASDIYHVSQKEAYNTPDLIDFAEKIFPESIRYSFSEQTLKDVRQAGRCLVFDLPTATGFHLARAIENVALEACSRIPDVKIGKHDFHGYIEALEAAGIGGSIIAELHRLREEYRNQLMHPEIFLTDIQVSVLISDIKNVMVELHNDLEQKFPIKTALSAALAKFITEPVKNEAAKG